MWHVSYICSPMGVVKMIKPLCLAALAVFAVASAQARPVFDPRDFQGRVVGQPTQVLVLGSPHLSQAPEAFDPSMLEPLLAKLARFRPDVITVEALSGQSLSRLWDYRDLYGDTAVSYGGRLMLMSASGRVGTGLDMPQAEAEARRQLSKWPSNPTPAQRRSLAALFATAGDPYSALVQWWRLDPDERRAANGITATLAAQLNEFDRRKNENHLIGARLAARLGLERVFPVDEQDDDVFTPEQSRIFAESVFPEIVKRMEAHPRMRGLMDLGASLASADQVLRAYRSLNEPGNALLQAQLEWLNVIDRPTPRQVGRVRMGGWEVRNLRMVANIRQVISSTPGKRVLVIIGSGHKAWFEAYLWMLTDVQTVDAQAVLR